MLKGTLQKLKNFVRECKRVILVTKKPTKEEFKNIIKVSGIGILAIGFVGFLVQVLKQIFVK